MGVSASQGSWLGISSPAYLNGKRTHSLRCCRRIFGHEFLGRSYCRTLRLFLANCSFLDERLFVSEAVIVLLGKPSSFWFPLVVCSMLRSPLKLQVPVPFLILFYLIVLAVPETTWFLSTASVEGFVTTTSLKSLYPSTVRFSLDRSKIIMVSKGNPVCSKSALPRVFLSCRFPSCCPYMW